MPSDPNTDHSLQQLKIATALAIGDGFDAPTDAHWHIAGQIAEISRRNAALLS